MAQDFGSETHPVADKSHRCVYCIERIAPGTRHMRFVGVFWGDWNDWRMHYECRDAHTENDSQGGDGTICDGGHLRGFSCREMELVRRITEEHEEREELYGVSPLLEILSDLMFLTGNKTARRK